MEIRENVPLAPYTTFGIGGPAHFFARIRSIEELRQSLDYARDQNLATLILGGGSNILVSDNGFNGLVLKIELQGVAREGDTLIAAAGESWDALVQRAVEEGLWGVENLSGIPGTVGAAPIQNIGAYGSELKDTLAWVEVLEIGTGQVMRHTNPECLFGYRTSFYKQHPGRFIVLRAAFALQGDGRPNTTYKDLQDATDLSLAEVRQRVLAIRSRKFPDLSLEGTAGSYFLNPVVPPAEAARLAAQYPGLPQFPTAGGVKVSLAWLLDHVLHCKGMGVGGARVFERQPIVLVAARNAKATDVRLLAQKIKEEVKNGIGIAIEEEVQQIFQ
jgi:UDP-N-acetylmuramate dehydrogenase